MCKQIVIMYQINGNTVSFRVNEDEREQINQIAEKLQTLGNTTYANGNQLFFALLQYCKQLENKAEPTNEVEAMEVALDSAVNSVNELNTIVNEYRKQLSTAVNVVYENDNFTDDQLITTVINVINSKPETITETETVTETKEVEKQLSENQLLLTLHPNWERKIELLNEIAKRRAKKYSKDIEPIEVLAEKMIFNDGTIFNLGGEFYTGY